MKGIPSKSLLVKVFFRGVFFQVRCVETTLEESILKLGGGLNPFEKYY